MRRSVFLSFLNSKEKDDEDKEEKSWKRRNSPPRRREEEKNWRRNEQSSPPRRREEEKNWRRNEESSPPRRREKPRKESLRGRREVISWRKSEEEKPREQENQIQENRIVFGEWTFQLADVDEEQLFSKPGVDVSNHLKNKITPAYECSVCYELLLDAMVLDCGHSICNGCVEKLTENICPQCKGNFTTPKKNFALRTIIEELEIYCPHQCGEETTITQLSEHEKTCSNYYLHCNLCSESVFHSNKTHHAKTECSNRRVVCHCNELVSFVNIQQHKDSECTHPILCHWCNEHIPTFNWKDHQNTCKELKIENLTTFIHEFEQTIAISLLESVGYDEFKAKKVLERIIDAGQVLSLPSDVCEGATPENVEYD